MRELPSYEWPAIVLGISYLGFILFRLWQWARYSYFIAAVVRMEESHKAYLTCLAQLQEMEHCLRELFSGLEQADRQKVSTVKELREFVQFDALGMKFETANRRTAHALALAKLAGLPAPVLSPLNARHKYLKNSVSRYLEANRGRRSSLVKRLTAR